MGNAADLELSAEGPVPPSTPSVSVELTVTPVLSLALAEGTVPVVSRLTLTSTDTVLRGATLRLAVEHAHGPLGGPVERTVDLDPGRTTVLGDLGLALDPAAMARVTEPGLGWVDVRLVAQDRLLVQRRVPVQVLATGQWLAAPLPLALELLAAHVQPADPAVTALVAEAAALLEEGTGNGTMAGYADDPDRVDEVIEALTWALRRREVRSAEPAAGWAEAGQRIRTPSEVLDDRLGTSLDVVVTLAAALEQVGLRPLVWVAEGHAFLGCWREDRSAETAAATDVAGLVDLIDRGRIRLVETTLLTDRGDNSHDLHGPAYAGWLTGDRSRVIGVTDVRRARQDGVAPLSAPRATTPAVTSAAEPGKPAAPAPPAQPDRSAAGSQGVPAQVQQWQETLLELGPGSPLLDHPEGSGLRLAVPPQALGTLAELVAAEATLTLLPGDRPDRVQVGRGPASARDLPAEELTALLTEERSVHLDATRSGWLPQLRELTDRARTVVAETGANDLHLALGSLVWELDGQPLRSPLVLVPVVLTAPPAGGEHRLTLDESGTTTPNRCLLDTLLEVHGLEVPGIDTPLADGTGVDVTGALQALRTALSAAGLPFMVEESAELAVLPAARYRQRTDLAGQWEAFTGNPLVAALVAGGGTAFTDPAPDTAGDADLDDLAAQLPVRADGAQLRAVAEAAAGRTFVLAGAPGTGKSQTITNLVARTVAAGRRVLVVAGKQAALDVVARRLDAIGMGPFTLDLHDKGSRPAVVRAQVRAALEHAVDVDARGLAADADDLRSSAASLRRYAEQLHARNELGTSFHSAGAALTAAPADVPALPVTSAFAARATAEAVTEVHHALALLPDIASLARPSAGHAWGFLDTIDIDITTVQRAAVAVDTAIRDLPGEGGLASVVRAARSDEDLDAIVHLLAGPQIGLDVLDEVRTPRWTAVTDDLCRAVAELVDTEHPGLDVATPAALDLPLADLFVQAQEAAASSWVGRRGKLVAVRDQLAPTFRPDAAVRPGDVPELTAALRRVQTAVQSIAGRATAVPGLQVPAGWNPFLDPGRSVLDLEVRWLRRAAASVDGATPFTRAMRRFLAAGPVADPAAARTVARLRDTLRGLLTACSSSSAQLAAWSGEDGLVLRWTMTRPERGVEYVHPMSLRRWVSLLDTLEPLRVAGLTEAREQLRHGVVRAEQAVRAFDRGLAEAAVQERREATGLDRFDAAVHEGALARFAASSRAVRSRLVSALPAGVLAARPFDPAGTDERVVALHRELAEQRTGVRGLLSTYGDLVTAALPCVLATPDTVARYLPAQAGLFDVVVFDEASQLRAADAVGALGRAWSAVVVGDGQQLPPTPGVQRVPADGVDGTDEESILAACLRVGVPQRELTWHYRSLDEALIAFSNAQYYGGRLLSFPAPLREPASAAPGGHGVSLLRVDGSLVRSGRGRNTNPGEAAAVVAEVLRHVQATPAVPSIAVVTVHPAQRALIEELLRSCGDARVLEALDRADGEGLIVRDLESVQGEERDVVLLSLGAGPDAAGRLPLDLGPLVRAGGERRLNVAVTRARRQVVVVASFDPEQLRPEETTSLGAQQLRGYLDLAARGTDALPQPTRSADRDAHRDDVAAALRTRDLVVRTDVGLSDFRIDLTVAPASTPDAPVLAVLLDGPEWAQRPTVGDRDGLPTEVLGERLGWPAVERVWLPTWLADRDGVLAGLVAAVEAATPVVVEPEPTEPVVAPEPEYDGPLADVIPLRPNAAQPTAPGPEAAQPTAPGPEAAQPTAPGPEAAEDEAAEDEAAEDEAAEDEAAEDEAAENESVAPGAEAIAPETEAIAPEAENESVEPEAEAIAPETEAIAPEAENESVAPETEAIAPGAVETEAVETEAFETAVAEPVAVETESETEVEVESVDVAPEAVVAEVLETAVVEPEVEPAAVEGEAVQAEAVEAAAAPEVAEPEVAEPVTEAAAEPEVAEPQITAPEVTGPVAPERAARAPVKTTAKVAARKPAPLDEEQPFIPWAPKPAGERAQLDQLSDPAVAKVVRRVLLAGIKAEGPIHRDRLARLTAGAFGLNRATVARRDALLRLLPPSALDGDHLWPASVDRATWNWFRRQASSTQRPLEQVAPREIGNAMVALCRASGALAEDELYQRTVEAFGHRRRTPALLPSLEAALGEAVAAGRLTRQPDGRYSA